VRAVRLISFRIDEGPPRAGICDGEIVHDTGLGMRDLLRTLIPEDVELEIGVDRAPIPVKASRPAAASAAMSAIDGPALHGSSGVPVTETSPASLWISRS